MTAGLAILLALCGLAAVGLVLCEKLPGTRARDRLARLFGGHQ